MAVFRILLRVHRPARIHLRRKRCVKVVCARHVGRFRGRGRLSSSLSPYLSSSPSLLDSRCRLSRHFDYWLDLGQLKCTSFHFHFHLRSQSNLTIRQSSPFSPSPLLPFYAHLHLACT